MHFFLKFGEYFSFRAIYVHAKFPHIYEFWKGRMNIGTALCVGVLLTPIGFRASSQNINTFKNK